ncbi:MAG TPA: hypothetical protein VNR36_13100 [Pseudolysinimonas sp.]|nr:hypothetical protein [Pseudolysinimonas sp.]
MSDEIPRELAEYEPGDRRPSRSARRLRAMRIVVTIAVAGLILPTLLVTIGTQISTADRACRIVVATLAPDSVGATARFELGGAAGPGWYCYAEQYGGTELLLRSLGLIPGLGPVPYQVQTA